MSTVVALSRSEIARVHAAYTSDRAGFIRRAVVNRATLHRALAGERVLGATRLALLAAVNSGESAADTNKAGSGLLPLSK